MIKSLITVLISLSCELCAYEMDEVWKIPDQIIIGNTSSLSELGEQTVTDKYSPLKCSTSELEETIKEFKKLSGSQYFPLLKDIRKNYPKEEKFSKKSPFQEKGIFDTAPVQYCKELALRGTCLGQNIQMMEMRKISYSEEGMWKQRDFSQIGGVDQIVFMGTYCRNSCKKMYKDVQMNLLPEFVQKLGGFNTTIKETFGEPILLNDLSQGMTDNARDRCLGVLAYNQLQPEIVPALHPVGFTKTRIPKKIFGRILTARKAMLNKDKFEVESCDLGMQNCARVMYSNISQECHLVSSENYLYGAIDKKTINSVFDDLRPLAEKWIGNKIELLGTSIYGIRKYTRGAWLLSHLDHLKTHVVSAILNIAQDVEEDWPLQILDHDGNVHELVLAPGDMVWYESAKLIHGRVKRLKGKSFENIFVHYMPRSLSWYDSDLTLTREPKKVISLQELEKSENEFKESRKNILDNIELTQKQQQDLYGQLSLEQKLSKLGSSDDSLLT